MLKSSPSVKVICTRLSKCICRTCTIELVCTCQGPRDGRTDGHTWYADKSDELAKLQRDSSFSVQQPRPERLLLRAAALDGGAQTAQNFPVAVIEASAWDGRCRRSRCRSRVPVWRQVPVAQSRDPVGIFPLQGRRRCACVTSAFT